MERVNESSCIPKRYKVYYDRKEEVIMRKIILASASPRRKDILEQVGISCEVIPSSIDEDLITADSPSALVEALSDADIQSLTDQLRHFHDQAS